MTAHDDSPVIVKPSVVTGPSLHLNAKLISLIKEPSKVTSSNRFLDNCRTVAKDVPRLIDPAVIDLISDEMKDGIGVYHYPPDIHYMIALIHASYAELVPSSQGQLDNLPPFVFTTKSAKSNGSQLVIQLQALYYLSCIRQISFCRPLLNSFLVSTLIDGCIDSSTSFINQSLIPPSALVPENPVECRKTVLSLAQRWIKRDPLTHFQRYSDELWHLYDPHRSQILVDSIRADLVLFPSHSNI
ncbi:hypothetical protein GEMRC1_007504 [Eukaryota sp. GEM-RC1]